MLKFLPVVQQFLNLFSDSILKYNMLDINMDMSYDNINAMHLINIVVPSTTGNLLKPNSIIMLIYPECRTVRLYKVSYCAN